MFWSRLERDLCLLKSPSEHKADASQAIPRALHGPDAIAVVGITFTDFAHLTGGSGDDFIAGDDDAHVLHGGPGEDVMLGGKGDDRLFGGGRVHQVLVGVGWRGNFKRVHRLWKQEHFRCRSGRPAGTMPRQAGSASPCRRSPLDPGRATPCGWPAI